GPEPGRGLRRDRRRRALAQGDRRQSRGSGDPRGAINDAEARDETADIARLLIYTSVGGLLLAALMAWIIAGQMLVPVRRIREAADTVTAEDLARRVPAAGPDEIVALADTVNAMLERVEDAYRTQREFLDDAGHEL